MSWGRVKWYDEKRGFGFITPLTVDESQEVFVHSTAIIMPYKLPRTLFPGDEVEFEIEEGKRGMRAKRVTVLRRAFNQDVQRRD